MTTGMDIARERSLVVAAARQYVKAQRLRWAGQCSLPEVIGYELELMHAVDSLDWMTEAMKGDA